MVGTLDDEYLSILSFLRSDHYKSYHIFQVAMTCVSNKNAHMLRFVLLEQHIVISNLSLLTAFIHFFLNVGYFFSVGKVKNRQLDVLHVFVQSTTQQE